jgi:hypothetical protein
MTDPPPPGAAPGRRPAVRRVMIIVMVVLAVCCAGSIAAGYGLLRSYASAARPAQAAAEKFLDDLERDDTAGAYRLLCADVRAHLPEDSFADLVHAQPRLRGHRVVGTSVSKVNGTTTALITADLTREGAAKERHTVRLVKVGSTWWVCGSPY